MTLDRLWADRGSQEVGEGERWAGQKIGSGWRQRHEETFSAQLWALVLAGRMAKLSESLVQRSIAGGKGIHGNMKEAWGPFELR